jgi:hypothetical protein
MRVEARISRRLLLVGVTVCVGISGCGESTPELPTPPVKLDVEGVGVGGSPDDLSEKGRRPAETFCDGPYSTASSC